MSEPRVSLFREEALRHRSAGGSDGDVLQLSPAWTRWTYWLVVAFFITGVFYCILGTLPEYATGPAVVWAAGHRPITTPIAGTVHSIEVKPGQQVEAGQLLVQFESTVETAELARIDREFELQLAKNLADPADSTVKAALTALRTQREVAAARLEQRSIRAPEGGFIGDIRIRSGQLLAAGDVVVTVGGFAQRYSILAMLPAHYRPQLHPGLTMRFEVKGYRYAYQELTISSVSEQIIGPNEVKRYLGQEIQDTLTVEGPVVLVEATPPSTNFVVDGETFDFYHGMNGTAEARVRIENIMFSIVPGLRSVFTRSRD